MPELRSDDLRDDALRGLMVTSVTQAGSSGAGAAHQATRRQFNEFFDIKDPTEFLGRRIDSFQINVNHRLPPLHADDQVELQRRVYARVEQLAAGRTIGDIDRRVVDYSDAKHPAEPARRYIEFRRSTVRETQVTTMFRCFVNGDNLYVAADSYVLGGLRWTHLLARLFMSLLVVWQMLDRASAGWMLVGLAVLLWLWWDTGRAARRDGLATALRWRFPKPIVNSSFDLDDALMFLKALLPMVTQALRDTFASAGLEEDSLMTTLRAIEQKVSGQGISLHAGGDVSIVGSLVAGDGNRVAGGLR